MCGVVAAQPLLPQLRVQLDLVDRGTDMCVVEQPPQVVWLEAGHPDHAPALIGVELLEGAPCLDVSVAAGPGPMDEVPVDLVEIELTKARLAGVEHAVVALVVVPPLR